MDVNARFALYYLCLQWAYLLQYYNVDGCAPGWTPERRVKACFKLYTNIKLDWSDAHNYCVDQDAYLTDMLDLKEQEFINDSILTKLHIDYGVWLGGTDRGTGNWKWATGGQMNIDLFSWREGNPDNGGGILNEFEFPSTGENCLQMSTETGFRGKLNDYYCDKKLYFVCKNTDMFNMTTPTPSSSSTSSSEESNHPINPSNDAIPIIISLFSALILVLVLVIILVTVRRKRDSQQPTNTTGLSFNEHVYTGLDDVFRSYPSDGLKQGAAKTQSTNGLLRGQYAEANIYDCPGTSNNEYQTLERVSSSEHVYSSPLGPDSDNRQQTVDEAKSATRSHDPNNKTVIKSISGYIDMERDLMPKRSASGYIYLNAELATNEAVGPRDTELKQNNQRSRDIDSHRSSIMLTDDGYVINQSH